ncbi:MAG: nitrate reductase, partial [Bradyrhizobium sp.]|nr:nitrate reductase [Bradyrhizobium sp.]
MLSHRTPLDRRALITGRVLTAEPVVAPPSGEIASIIVQTRPDQLDRVAAGI